MRLFNPFRIRNRSVFSKVGQFLVEGQRLNRRMHNKSFIVDGMQAIIGGRNIGDAYFDAGDEVHFRDLDVLAIGPVVPKISAMFDAYWNCELGVSGDRVHVDPCERRGTRARCASRWRKRCARVRRIGLRAGSSPTTLPNGPSADRKGHWFWGPARLVADDPDKVDPARDGDGAADRAAAQEDARRGARREALLISPYFIPGENGVRYLGGLAARGVTVKVLTNSLAATDEPEVHAGYARYRIPLLEAGVDLYELRPASGQAAVRHAYGTSSGESLHAKSMIVDAAQVFVGSMNLDPRSRKLNTEMGVIVDSPELAAALSQLFRQRDRARERVPRRARAPDGTPDETGCCAGSRWTTASRSSSTTIRKPRDGRA